MFVIATPAGASPPQTPWTLRPTWPSASSRLGATPGRARPMPLPLRLASSLAIVSRRRATSACPVQPPRHVPRRPRSREGLAPPRSWVHRAPREGLARQTADRSGPIHGPALQRPAKPARRAGRKRSRKKCPRPADRIHPDPALQRPAQPPCGSATSSPPCQRAHNTLGPGRPGGRWPCRRRRRYYIYIYIIIIDTMEIIL